MLVPPLALRIGQGRFVVRIREIHLPGRLLSEVATLVDDVRYCGRSGLSADVEFPAEFDPMQTFSQLRFVCPLARRAIEPPTEAPRL